MLQIVSGGSGSGKSAYAEQEICRRKKQVEGGTESKALYYIATMIPGGAETAGKIRRHQDMRAGKGFISKDCYVDLADFVEKELPVSVNSKPSALLECMSNLVANELYVNHRTAEETIAAVLKGVSLLCRRCRDVAVVTNEVFAESGEDSDEMKIYKQTLANINCRLAEMADQVTEVVCGIPVNIKTKEMVSDRDMEKEDRGMKLVIGGAYQGKLKYAMKKYGGQNWQDGEVCALDAVYQCDGIYHFEAYLKRLMKAGQENRELTDIAAQIAGKHPELVIVCREVGAGLVPVDAFERAYREQVGRVCTRLAAEAVQVVRVFCGIGNIIKGGD